MTALITHHVNGAAFSGRGQRQQDVTNPATAQVSAKVQLGGPEDVAAAVAAAQAAFPAWADLPPLRRARILFKFLELLNQHRNDLAQLITREHGKTLPDAEGEVGRGLEVVEHACAITSLQLGEIAENAATGVEVYTLMQPIDRKSTRLNSSHEWISRMPSSA